MPAAAWNSLLCPLSVSLYTCGTFPVLLLGKWAPVLGMDKLLHGNQEMAVPHPHHPLAPKVLSASNKARW